MIKVIFSCNWNLSPHQLLKKYSKQTPNEAGIWKNIMGVSNIAEADYYIVLENSSIKTHQDKTIFVKREPDIINPIHPKYKHTITFNDDNTGIHWWINKTYDELKNMKYPNKTKIISCVASSKHSHRAKYIRRLMTGDSLVDLYGRGHDAKHYGVNYKGPLNYDGNCKLKGMLDYEYSLVLENSQQNNYFTEKLADAYLSWSMPIYWGCPNIANFFPETSYHSIDINHKNPIEEINEIINKPVDIEALAISRNYILDRFNIWEIISQKIQEIQK